MIVTELQQIQNLWTNKYPNLLITLYCNEDETKYFGKIMSNEFSVDIQADTISELISQAEINFRNINVDKT